MRSAILAMLGVTLVSTVAWADPPREIFVDPPHGLQKNLMNGAFDELEAIAAEDRDSRARYAGGEWAIVDFYEILARYDQTSGPCTRKVGYSFDDKRGALERWLATKPDSQTARIALALLWDRWAWTGRGCDFADKTSPEQWQAFHDRLERARDLLKTVDHDADPEAYRIEMDVALIDEHPKEKEQSIYERAIRPFPSLPDYAKARYNYLLPRWFGAPGEAAAFAKSLLTTPGGETGLHLYFDVATAALDTERQYDILFDATGIDYPTLVRAFASRVGSFGPLKSDMNVLLFYAMAARDFKTADLLATKIGDDWDRSFWGDKATYDSVLLWIRQWRVLTSSTHG